MSKLATIELLQHSASIYHSKRSRKAKSIYLRELQQLTGYKSIKTIIRHLNQPKKPRTKEKRGRHSKLQPQDIKLLKQLWFDMDQPCGKRFVSMISDWLPFWISSNHPISPDQQERILHVSSSTLDRALRPYRIQAGKRAKSGSIGSLKASIPIIDARRQITRPGQMYADTVAHCGESVGGSFAWTLTFTDDYTQWVCNQAVWNKGQYGVCRAFDKLLRTIPFKVTGINTDNGTEFLNHHLQNYFKQNHPNCVITRSRPMHKNDNARAEEKNRHKVRDLIGYQRLDDERFIKLLNDIYRSSNLLNNHFISCMKVMSKTRVGSKIIKRYDQARTPYARAMESLTNKRSKEALKTRHENLNPFQLKEKIENGLRKLFALKSSIDQEARGLLAPLSPSAAYDAAPGSNNEEEKRLEIATQSSMLG